MNHTVVLPPDADVPGGGRHGHRQVPHRQPRRPHPGRLWPAPGRPRVAASQLGPAPVRLRRASTPGSPTPTSTTAGAAAADQERVLRPGPVHPVDGTAAANARDAAHPQEDEPTTRTRPAGPSTPPAPPLFDTADAEKIAVRRSSTMSPSLPGEVATAAPVLADPGIRVRRARPRPPGCSPATSAARCTRCSCLSADPLRPRRRGVDVRRPWPRTGRRRAPRGRDPPHRKRGGVRPLPAFAGDLGPLGADDPGAGPVGRAGSPRCPCTSTARWRCTPSRSTATRSTVRSWRSSPRSATETCSSRWASG